MAILPIRQFPDPVLRKQCTEVSEIDPQLLQLLEDMAETMYQAPGIGLAAPQVGVSLRAIVVDVGPQLEAIEQTADGSPDDESSDDHLTNTLFKMVNPVILQSEGLTEHEEGCLSIPGITEKVQRPESITVAYTDIDGCKCQLEANGLLSVCIQHEIDHLNGVLFVDKLKGVRKHLVKSKLKKLAS